MNSKKLSILIVDDHPIVREGLAQLLEEQSFTAKVYKAENANDAIKIIDLSKIDFAIIDISLKGISGLDLIKNIRKNNSTLLILVLSMHDAELYAERSLRSGANGYLMKSEKPNNIIEAINSIIDDGFYLSSNISSKILKGFINGYSNFNNSQWDILSDRELEVLILVGEGLSTKDIAEKLSLSPKTIDTHKENLKKKLSITNKNDLLLKAIAFVQESKNTSYIP